MWVDCGRDHRDARKTDEEEPPLEQWVISTTNDFGRAVGEIDGRRIHVVELPHHRPESHDTDGSEMAYKIAASMAFKEAVARASAVLLEPVMSAEVVTPDAYMGNVIADLSARRGKVLGMALRHGLQAVQAEVPLAGMFGYSTSLRSASEGRATYSMQFHEYAPVPSAAAEALIAKTRGW